jgi:hypothetical protein
MRAWRAEPVWAWMENGKVTEVWYKIPGSPNPLKPRIPIHEHYGEFKPNLNVRRIIEKLLDSVDPEYLQGLGSIVLSSQTQLPRRGRRKKFLSRGRKHPVSSVLGFYRQSWKGKPASIELYVDKILAQAPGWWAHFPLVGFFLFAHVLFHELGHHLHKTRRPEFKEREDVAEGWEKKLTKIAFRKRYRRVMSVLTTLATGSSNDPRQTGNEAKNFNPPTTPLNAITNVRNQRSHCSGVIACWRRKEERPKDLQRCQKNHKSNEAASVMRPFSIPSRTKIDHSTSIKCTAMNRSQSGMHLSADLLANLTL